MTKIILPLSILASLILRILLPYQTILGGAFVKFADPDSYLYANNVRILAETGKADSLYTIMLYDFSKLFGSEVGMMVLPLLLNVVTLFTIYVICRLLWGKTQALIASAIFAILPGEYLGRSLFGTIDHHVFEVTLTTLAILFVLLAIDAKKWMRVWYIAIAIIPITLYAFVWSGYWLFAAILAIFGVLLLLKKVNKPIITGLVIVMGVVGVAGIMRNALDFSTLSWQTTGETQPIFAGLSIVALLPYALTVMGSFYCWKDYKETKDNKILLLIVWNIIMLLATTFQRRFGYYLAVNGSLMFGYLVYKSALSIDTQRVKLVSLAITGSLCIAMIPLSVSISRNVYYAPSDDWMDAAQYIRQYTERDAVITTWWDYGYFLMYETQREVSASPSQNWGEVAFVADAFTTPDAEELRGIEYLVLDDEIMNVKYGMVEQTAGRVGDYSIAQRLWHGEQIPYIGLLYSNDTVRVYAVSQGIREVNNVLER